MLINQELKERLAGEIILENRPNHSSNGLCYANEQLFGVSENNSQGCDIPEQNTELKAKTIDSDCLITLMCREPKRQVKGSAIRYFTERYAAPTIDPLRNNLYHTMRIGSITNIAGAAFEITRSSDKLSILVDGTEEAHWKLDKAFWKGVHAKIGGNLLLSKGSSQYIGENKFKHNIKTIDKYSGFSREAFVFLIDSGKITFDFRAHSLDVQKLLLKIRNHGTAFRTKEESLSVLYGSRSTFYQA